MTPTTTTTATAAERYGFVLLDVASGPPSLYGLGDVVADESEAAAWAAEVNAAPPMTPFGPLRVTVAALVAVTT